MHVNLDSLEHNKKEDFGGCQNCFIETLSKIQKDRHCLGKEISASLKNIKEAEIQRVNLEEKSKK